MIIAIFVKSNITIIIKACKARNIDCWTAELLLFVYLSRLLLTAENTLLKYLSRHKWRYNATAVVTNFFGWYTKSIVFNDSFYKISYLSLVYMINLQPSSKNRIYPILCSIPKAQIIALIQAIVGFYFYTISRRFTLTASQLYWAVLKIIEQVRNCHSLNICVPIDLSIASWASVLSCIRIPLRSYTCTENLFPSVVLFTSPAWIYLYWSESLLMASFIVISPSIIFTSLLYGSIIGFLTNFNSRFKCYHISPHFPLYSYDLSFFYQSFSIS